MTPCPVPEAPPCNHHIRARYVPSRGAVAFTARCDCGSGRDATWTESMRDGEKPLDCECTCAAVPAVVA